MIDRLIAILRDSGSFDAPEPFVDVGDDAAVLKHIGGYAIHTTDTMVDGVHFRAGHMPWFDVGWKSIASNQSDIAAMGGTPTSALVTLGVPKGTDPVDMDEMYRGMADALHKFGGMVVGGDVVTSPVMFVTVAMTGVPQLDPSGEPIVMTRSAAEPGDLIAVTGPLGGSAGGLTTDLRGIQGVEADALRQLHYRPEPRVSDGKILVELGVRCAMDISDGLVADTQKLAKASRLSARLNSTDVPMPDLLTNLFPGEALEMALTGGEDYELLFAAPHDMMDRALARLGRRARYIGRFVERENDESMVTVLDVDGNPMRLKRTGWDHLVV